MRLINIVVCGLVVSFCSCNYSEPYVVEVAETTVSKNLEDMNSYDYKYYTGFNTALSQFGQSYPELYVDLTNKRVVDYTSSEYDSDEAYADGYHDAIRLIDSKRDTRCPHFH